MDKKPQVTIPADLLDSLIEYATRFAADNNEPSDGDCWRTIDRAEEIRDTAAAQREHRSA